MDVSAFTVQTCKAFADFAAQDKQLNAFTFDKNKLYRVNFVFENVTTDNTTPRIMAASVAFKGAVTDTTPALVNTGAADSTGGATYAAPTNLIGAACLSSTTISIMTIVDKFDYDYSNVIPKITSTTTQMIDDPDRVTPKVACALFDATKDVQKIIDTASTPTNMCDYYVKNNQANTLAPDAGIDHTTTAYGAGGVTLYECLRCPIGKQAIITKNTTGTAATILRQNMNVALTGAIGNAAETVQYITSCDAFTGCDSTKTVVYGLQQHWIKLFSCYFCTTSGVPVLIMKAVDKNKPIFFNWSRVNLAIGKTALWTSVADNVASVSNIACIDISNAATIRSALTISDQITTVAKMPGCGLGVLDTNYGNTFAATNKFDNTIWGTSGSVAITTNGALICAACSPNFRPTYYNSTILWKDGVAGTDVNLGKNWFVTDCAPIANCTSTSNIMMNGCQKCDAGFAFMARTKQATPFEVIVGNVANQYID